MSISNITTVSSAYGVIYVATNKVNNKQYVGQTRQKLKTRWARHCSDKAGYCTALSAAIKKYGRDSFGVDVVAKAYSKDELDALESMYVQALGTLSPSGYNLRSGGGSRSEFTEDAKNRMRAAHSTPEAKKAHMESTKRLWKSGAYDHVSGILRQLWENEENIAKASRTQKMLSNAPDEIARRRKVMQDLYANPVFAEKMKHAASSAIAREKKSIASTAYWSSQENRAAKSKNQTEKWKDAGYRQKAISGMIELWDKGRREWQSKASRNRLSVVDLPARKDSKSGIRGVRLDKQNRWQARVVGTDGKLKHLGCFGTSDEASAAYMKAKSEIFEALKIVVDDEK